MRLDEAKKTPILDATPLRSGMSFAREGRKLDLPAEEDWADQYRRVYGYIGEIKFLPTLITPLTVISMGLMWSAGGNPGFTPCGGTDPPSVTARPRLELTIFGYAAEYPLS